MPDDIQRARLSAEERANVRRRAAAVVGSGWSYQPHAAAYDVLALLDDLDAAATTLAAVLGAVHESHEHADVVPLESCRWDICARARRAAQGGA